jgi:hypothetical protein
MPLQRKTPNYSVRNESKTKTGFGFSFPFHPTAVSEFNDVLHRDKALPLLGALLGFRGFKKIQNALKNSRPILKSRHSTLVGLKIYSVHFCG